MSHFKFKPLVIALGVLLASMTAGQTALAQDSSMPSGSMQDKSMTHNNMVKHESMWAAMDTDNDGYISKSEHAAYMDSMFTKADTNGDGKLSKDEMQAAMTKVHGRPMSPDDMSKTWAAMDMDKDGYISRSEHAAYMGAMFDKVDTNGDGKISKEEMQASMKMMHH